MTGAIRIGTAPGTWGVEPVADPDQPPWELVLDEVASAGFEGIELGPLGYLPEDPARLAGELSRRGLRLSAGYVMEPLHDPRETVRVLHQAERTCSVLARAGARTLVVIGSLVRERSAAAGRKEHAPKLEGWRWATFVRMLGGIVDRACEHGLSAVFHPHAGTYVEFEEEIDRILDAAGSRLGLCIDTGHCLYSGVDAGALLGRYADRVGHVHLKDVRGEVLRSALESGLTFEQAVAAGTFCALGEGNADLEGFLAGLRAIGYEGWATYEQDRLAAEHAEARPEAEASLSYLGRLGVGPRSQPAGENGTATHTSEARRS